MANSNQYPYDVSISYAKSDQDWIDGQLLPQLEQADLKIFYDDLAPGAPHIQNLELTIKQSRRTIVLLTPDWVHNEWKQFEGLLLRSADPAALQRKLLPTLLKPCDIPEYIAVLELIDLTQPTRYERELRRLIRGVEDSVSRSFPLVDETQRFNLHKWRQWLRRYRWRVGWSMVMLWIFWVATFTWLKWPPFHDRLVWMPAYTFSKSWQTRFSPDDLHRVLYNTGTTLLAGRTNTGSGCNLPDKGLWHYPLITGAHWAPSDVDDLLCIPNWNGEPALSDIQSIRVSPGTTNPVYVLTSHTGVLVSTDSGATFDKHPASVGLAQLQTGGNYAGLLAVDTQSPPNFWVAGIEYGLWRYHNHEWVRLDSETASACWNLQPGLHVTALLLVENLILIGSQQAGLWLSNDKGATCRRIYDHDGRYTFERIYAISANRQRFLAQVVDEKIGAGTPLGKRQLLDFCPRASMCSAHQWAADVISLPSKDTPIEAMHVQLSAQGNDEWYLLAGNGGIWQGDMQGNPPKQLPSINRCWLGCAADFTDRGKSFTPYLLVNHRVYTLIKGSWWRLIWP